MIATCPHCSSGFYISSETAGNVIKCSKCKKEVRAPDRRGCAPGALTAPDDGIPFAILAETKAEAEEHLKNETEARLELEKKIKDALDGRTKAEALALTAKQEKERIEVKINGEIDARLKAEVQVESLTRELTEVKTKLKEIEDAHAETQAQLQKESETRKQFELQLQAETETRIKAESQTKAEALAKKKYQSQAESETAERIKLEQELATVKSTMQEVKIVESRKKPLNFIKGLVRVTFILSLMAAVAGGYIAYINGYIINSHFDRPMHLPLFSRAVYLPVNLIAISICSYLAAWAVLLIIIFVIKGFSKSNSNKSDITAQSSAILPENIPLNEVRTWRSS